MRAVPPISYARSADGVSLAFTLAGDGPALVFVPWVPFSNLRMEWQNTLLRDVLRQLAQRLTVIHYDGWGWNAMTARQTQALLSLVEQDWDVFADTAAHQWLGWSAGEAGRGMADGIQESVTPQVARATLRVASATDVTEQLPSVAAPTLVLHRRDMTQIPLDVSRSLAEDLPAGRLVVLEGAQPSLFMEDPATVVSTLTAFFCDGVYPAAEAAQGTGRTAPGYPAASGRVSFPYTEVYAAAKDGLIGFTRVLRSDYHARGVSASVLILGAIRDAGQGQRMLDESGMKASGFMAPAESVARAVVKAVKTDRVELVIMPGPARLMRAIMDYFPGLGPAMNRAAGATSTMQKIIDAREAKPDIAA